MYRFAHAVKAIRTFEKDWLFGRYTNYEEDGEEVRYHWNGWNLRIGWRQVALWHNQNAVLNWRRGSRPFISLHALTASRTGNDYILVKPQGAKR